VPVDTAVKVRRSDGTEQEAKVRDLSASGIFLYSDSALAVGTRLEMVINLPPGLAPGLGGCALCQASVVRLDEKAGQTVGIAAVFDRIELLPEIVG
jgi:hypothetical protein